jgi:hypothetical protein
MAAGMVDDGEWPLVVVHWPPGTATDGDVETILARLTTYYGRRHAVLHDGMHTGGMSAHARRRAAAHSNQYEEDVRRWVVASAVVATSSITRAIIKTVQWMAPPPSPFRVFGDLAEAREWLLQALRRAGLWRPDQPET